MSSRLLASLLCAGAMCALGASVASAQVGKPDVLYYKSWAVIIGIEDYAVAPSREGAVADAKAVATTMRDLGFEEIIELYDQQANGRQIRHIMDEFLPRKLGRQDRLVVFFAGHAGSTVDMDGERVGYLVPWDAPTDSAAKGITLHELKQFSRRIMSKHILFFLDSDVSGWRVTPEQQLSLEGRTAPEEDTEKRAVQVLAAARDGEPVVRRDGRGLFVQTVLTGLKGASDANGDGSIHASELAAYVTDQVQAASQGAQHPQFAKLVGDGDMILRPGSRTDSAEPRTEEERRAAARKLYSQALDLLMNQKPAQEALSRLNQALRYDPRFGDAYILKGYVLLDLIPNPEGALAAAAQGVEHAPDNADAHFTFGLALERQEHYQEAEVAYLRALKVNPSYTDVYLILGDLYAQHLDAPDKSVDAYEQYLRLGGTSNRARDYVDKARSQKEQGG